MSEAYDKMPSFDQNEGELVGSNGEDYVVISAEALRRINKQEELMLGTGSFVIWYNAGKAVGRTDGHKYAPLMQTMDLNKVADYLRETYSRYGWGSVQFEGIILEKGEMSFTVQNSPLIRGIRSREPRCWFVRGFVEGLTSELIGAECTAVELACESVNRDHCEFKLTWDFAQK